ncbi:hypothetical protein V1524DRAFT_441964 [Lipomyces starkeyi]
MSTVYQNIAIVGAGGNLGPFIIKALVAENFNVTVLSRASSQATFPASVRVLKGEYTPEFFVSTLKGQDAVVMAVSSSALAEQRAIIEAAAVAGIKRIIPSEFGSDTMNPLVVHAVPVFQGKVEIVDYLKLVSAKNPQLTWTAIINGPFFDWVRAGGSVFHAQLRTELRNNRYGPLVINGFTWYGMVKRVVVETFRQGEENTLTPGTLLDPTQSFAIVDEGSPIRLLDCGLPDHQIARRQK